MAQVQTPAEEFIKIKELAKYVSIPIPTLKQYTAEKRIPSYKFGRHRLYRLNEVIERIEATREG